MPDITALTPRDLRLIQRALYHYADITQEESQEKCLELADTISIIQTTLVEQDHLILSITKGDLIDSGLLTQQEADAIREDGLEEICSRITQELYTKVDLPYILEDLGYRIDD